MRDLDRVREKIEVRLEPRQLVVLAVVTAVFCGGLFAGGYLLGRSQAPSTSLAPVTGHLASIDAFSAPGAVEAAPAAPASDALGEVEFMFPSALGARPARKRAPVKPMKLSPVVVAEKAGPAPKADRVPAAPKSAAARAAPTPKVVAPISAAPRVMARVAPAAPRPARRAPPPVERHTATAERGSRVAPAAPAPARPALPDIDDEDAPPDRGSRHAPRHFTLQLKAAKDRDEAARYAAELRQAGYTPHIVLATVPGKGRFYRVRLGDFASRDAARRFQRKLRRDSGRADAGFVTEL